MTSDWHFKWKGHIERGLPLYNNPTYFLELRFFFLPDLGDEIYLIRGTNAICVSFIGSANMTTLFIFLKKSNPTLGWKKSEKEQN